jgi:hypothetical protein
MNTHELVARLENVALPDLVPENHRRELRTSLLSDYDNFQARRGHNERFAWLRARPLLWRTALITSALWVAIAVIMVGLDLLPGQRPSSDTARTVSAVMAHPLVRAALAGSEASEITVTSLGNDVFEVVIEGGGGTMIIARADARNDTVTILDITYVILFGSGSMYAPPEAIVGEDLQQVLSVARTNSTFRELMDKGATVAGAEAIQTLVSRRDLIAGSTTETREQWAMVRLYFEGQHWSFLVDPAGSRVMHLGTRRAVK